MLFLILPNQGQKEREWHKKYTFILGLGFGLLMLLAILFRGRTVIY